MARKNYKRSGKKYSIEDRLQYHSSRSRAPGRFGLKFGGTKMCYSDGFREAFTGRNNEAAVRGEFGAKSGNAYAMGYKRGRKAALEYFDKTGKQPFDLAMKY